MKKEIEDKFERNIQWLRESLKQDKIELNIKHNIALTELLKESKDEFIEEFIDSFEYKIGLLSDEEFEQLKKGEGKLIKSAGLCHGCGEFVALIFTGTKVIPGRFKNQEIEEFFNCNKPKKEFSVEINFPTGELICDDYPMYAKELFKKESNTEHSLNSLKGIYETTMNFAKKNVLNVYVGNSCPDVWVKNNDKLAIGNSYEKDNCTCDSDNYINCECEYIELTPINGESIATICTDLWWATVVDVGTYRNLLVEEFGEIEGEKMLDNIKKCNTKIKPGVYRCTYFNGSANDYTYEKEEPVMYCKIEWIKEAC